jgi:tetratricopeptide (TPR) repeat protein
MMFMKCNTLEKHRLAGRIMALLLTLGWLGAGCQRLTPPAPATASTPRSQPAATPAENVDDVSRVLWDEQMKSAASALHQKYYALAEQNCLDALKTAGKFSPTDLRLTTNMVYLAGIYQTENKSDLAEQTFKAAVATCEQAVGTNHPSLVMPLDTLANFYYFAEHRYDLATPVCLRILQIVAHTPSRNDAEVEKRARAVATVYRVQSQFAQAEPYYRQSLELAEKSPDRLPTALLVVSGFYHDWGKYDQAEALCQRALAIQEQVAASDTNSDAQMKLAITLYGLGENYRGWGKLDQAESCYDRSVQLVRKTLGQDSTELARPLSGLAATLAAEGRTAQAVADYQQALGVTDNKLAVDDPVIKAVLDDYTALLDHLNRSEEANALRLDHQWRVLIDQSQHARRNNDLDDAERLASQALDLVSRLGHADSRVAKSQVQMAEVYRQQGKTGLAEQSYLKAIASGEQAVGTNGTDLILPLESLANFYYYTKVQYNEVTSLYQRILNIIQAAPNPNLPEIARWQRDLADVYHLEKQESQAETCYQLALSTMETATDCPAGDKVQYLQALADCYRNNGKYALAEELGKRALAIREQASGPEAGPDAQLDVAVCCDSLAQIYLAWNKPVQAEAFYRRSLPLVEQVAGADSTDLTPRLLGLATALRAQKKFPEAEVQYKRALAITQKSIGPEAPQVAEVLDQYAGLLAEIGKPEDAKGMRDWADYVRQQDALRTSN